MNTDRDISGNGYPVDTLMVSKLPCLFIAKHSRGNISCRSAPAVVPVISRDQLLDIDSEEDRPELKEIAARSDLTEIDAIFVRTGGRFDNAGRKSMFEETALRDGPQESYEWALERLLEESREKEKRREMGLKSEGNWTYRRRRRGLDEGFPF